MRIPTIMVPYQGPCDTHCTDFFVYLRPESNGVLVESLLMGVITKDERYRGKVQIAYMANFPGSFILERKIVEQHYALRYHFAIMGGKAFTQDMKTKFTRYFGVPFEDAKIIGAFEALELLKLNPEDLFDLWVAPFDMTTINGQIIKRKDDLFILNYDIPALLHKNNLRTDIAVMIFRTSLDWLDIHCMIAEMSDALVANGVLAPSIPPSRVFHYSKSPFESILDAKGYLIDQRFQAIPISETTFAQYLMSKGVELEAIDRAVRDPIFVFETPENELIEEDLFTFTMSQTYEDSYNLWKNAVKQVKIIERE